MSESLHQRANELMAWRRIEPLSREDEQWLAAHLAGCEPCTAADARTSEALSALRGMQINLPRNLASRTQLRVRLRTEELREHGPASRLIWAVAAISWILGLATAPLVWRGFAWLGSETGTPKLVLQLGFVLWWGLPALLAAGIVLWKREWRGQGAE
jgi:hypothetical protein